MILRAFNLQSEMDPMQIEHTTKRPNGSHHSIDGVAYHFAPNAAGDHVAEVTDKAHIQRFLSIPTFVIYEEGASAPQAGENSQSVSLDMGTPLEPETKPLEDATDEELAAIYFDVLDRKPHHRAGRDTIIEQIREALTKEGE